MKSIASRSVLFSLFSVCKTTSEVLCLVWGSAGQGRKTMTHWCDFSGGHHQAGEGAGAHGIGEQADRTGSFWPRKELKLQSVTMLLEDTEKVKPGSSWR